ncbi:acetyl-CoA carboxylase biotin carboxyl carrier protein [Anaerostipes sp. MSJ-23]|uniref:acetyl-CoA carboxylase biotin carboxyl carrier protein n=1 Tax=unclassified Anaerostipes TaxID=2635253 RepID=UPI001C10A9E1|nr:acetyl-CoA carboxylase biotin carboxyl carrier protein [Anaerostipes sp. MSJ-23]MBU5460970.1 acetyl-CoA carboxylase biotin carboxyl carrier protein [Anaerostipes sp. MSJ-23]
MDIQEMKELIQAVSNSNIDKFKFENDEYKITLEKNEAKIVTSEDLPKVQEVCTVAAPEKDTDKAQVEGNQVTAPLVGTFYAAPAEDADPFVSVGDTVKKGQVIGIVEAMKLMNEVESDYEGTVTDILVENGEMVEYGQPLIIVQ